MFNKFKLSKFCTENRGLLLQLAYSWSHNRAQAEDLVQDATEKALKNIGSLKNTKAIKAWFIQIMLNCWRDILRKKQDIQNIDDLILDEKENLAEQSHLCETITPEHYASKNQIQTMVQYAIGRLPIKYRTVLTLIDIHGDSYSEVAQIVGIPIGTVMSRVSRARQELIKILATNTNGNTVVSIHNNTVSRGDE